jgi:hypothetical protein
MLKITDLVEETFSHIPKDITKNALPHGAALPELREQ